MVRALGVFPESSGARLCHNLRVDRLLSMWCPFVKQKLNIKKREPMSTTHPADFGKSISRRSGASQATARKCISGQRRAHPAARPKPTLDAAGAPAENGAMMMLSVVRQGP